MGKTKDSKLGISSQTSLTQCNVDIQIDELVKEDMINILTELNVKFNKDDLILVTKDKTNQIVWLEIGSNRKGLKHILYGDGDDGHIYDFINYLNIQESQIIDTIKDVISNWKVEYSIIVIRNGKDGYERMYSKDDKYMLAGIGLNGFITSIYPFNKNKAIERIRRYKCIKM